jgi:hypothetical protein
MSQDQARRMLQNATDYGRILTHPMTHNGDYRLEMIGA